MYALLALKNHISYGTFEHSSKDNACWRKVQNNIASRVGVSAE